MSALDSAQQAQADKRVAESTRVLNLLGAALLHCGMERGSQLDHDQALLGGIAECIALASGQTLSLTFVSRYIYDVAFTRECEAACFAMLEQNGDAQLLADLKRAKSAYAELPDHRMRLAATNILIAIAVIADAYDPK
jgi:hypothetical protein